MQYLSCMGNSVGAVGSVGEMGERERGGKAVVVGKGGLPLLLLTGLTVWVWERWAAQSKGSPLFADWLGNVTYAVFSTRVRIPPNTQQVSP